MQDPWQTRASAFHPYVVDGIDGLPESIRNSAKVALPAGSTFLRALVVPQDYRSEGSADSTLVPEQALIFTDLGAVHLRATPVGQTPQPASYFQPDTLLYMRSSHLLLYGRVELVYARQSGIDKLDMTFNAVGWPLMGPAWRDLVREIINCTSDEPNMSSEEVGAILESVPPKFVDGLQRYALYTGENLWGAIFQPAIWREESLFASEEQITPSSLLVWTDCSIVVLSEERALVRQTEQPGLIVTRIPRQAIHDVSSTPHDSWQELKISLERGGVTTTLTMFVEPEKADLWRKLFDVAR